jgi:anti-sigma factor RsiW
MNHQPFENWLLSEEPLPEENQDALQAHLADCEQCHTLQEAWLDIATLFAEIPDIGPEPGFVNRWQANLEADRTTERAMRQRWQSWIFLVVIANGASLALILMGLQLSRTYDSMTDLILSWVYRAATIMVMASGFQNVMATLSRTIPNLIPASWWIGIAITLSVSTLLWIVSMTKLTSLPRRTS